MVERRKKQSKISKKTKRKYKMLTPEKIVARQPEWYCKLKLVSEVEAQCDDCGEDIEEWRYYNEEGQEVHITSHTNGHYYNDGSKSCEACHERNR